MIAALGLAAVLALAASGAPAFDDVRAAWTPSDVAVLDRHGKVVHEVRVDPRRRRLAWAPLHEVSPALRDALVTAEDRRFRAHSGVDVRAVAAAALARVTGGPRRGASTITMQVAALLDPSLARSGGTRSMLQKWRQMRQAWALEARWSKDEILEAYVNLVTFRGELQGIGAASAVLFGKAPHGLSDAEATVIAVLVRAPNATMDRTRRRAHVLAGGRMNQIDLEGAVARALSAAPGTGPRVTLAPHAAQRVLTAGAGAASTLDAAMQRAAIEALRRQLVGFRERHVQDGAVLVVDNATGDVLAYVGGSSELSSARYVDGIQGRRQAGSSLKPFLYGLALEQRLLTPASLLDDSPLDVAVATGLYRPENYDRHFRGLVSARVALASSLNIPAVRVLGLVGEEAFAGRLRALGFAGLREAGDFYGPSLALGAADVTLWELANAYRTLANGGVWSPLRLGATEPRVPARRVLAPAAAFLVTSMLADRESRSATFGLENPLGTRFWTAAKTGTSKDMRDNWCVGYSRRYTVAVWTGNFSGEPMRQVSGITGAAPVWLEVMEVLHAADGSEPPSPPAGLVALAGEWFLRGTEPLAVTERTAPRPTIVWPVSGTIIAIDPDIPMAHQRVAFEARDAGAGVRFTLDGADVGEGEALTLWAPLRGRHRLELVTGDRRVHDSVTFEVRGPR